MPSSSARIFRDRLQDGIASLRPVRIVSRRPTLFVPVEHGLDPGLMLSTHRPSRTGREVGDRRLLVRERLGVVLGLHAHRLEAPRLHDAPTQGVDS